MTLDWIFPCEDIEVGPDDEVVSMIRIFDRTAVLERARLPLTLRPFFVAGLRGKPAESLKIEIEVTMGDPSKPATAPEEEACLM